MVSGVPFLIRTDYFINILDFYFRFYFYFNILRKELSLP